MARRLSLDDALSAHRPGGEAANKAEPDGAASQWDHLPPEILSQIMQRCMLSSSPGEAEAEVVGVGNAPVGGNCKHLLVASGVCGSWRQLVCFHPGLLTELRATINEARPFSAQQLPTHMLRLVTCPPFPLLIAKAAAAGNPSANFALATLLDLQGMGNSAMKHWRKAAKYGYRRAQLRIGEAYYKGTCNMPLDGEEAYFWLARSVRSLEDRPEAPCPIAGKALLLLAFILFDGEGVQRDCEEAVRLFKRAAAYGSKDAEHTLGSIYNTGQYGAQSRWAP